MGVALFLGSPVNYAGIYGTKTCYYSTCSRRAEVAIASPGGVRWIRCWQHAPKLIANRRVVWSRDIWEAR